MMLCGGEALPAKLAGRLSTGGGRLWNLYGPTETTIWSSAGRVTSPVGDISLGEPLANTRFTYWIRTSIRCRRVGPGSRRRGTRDSPEATGAARPHRGAVRGGPYANARENAYYLTGDLAAGCRTAPCASSGASTTR